MSTERAPIAARRAYIDWVRGAAVLVMIEAHTLDAWTRPGDRAGLAFQMLTVLGGFAAPLFLWLAGLGLALSATRMVDRTGSRSAAAGALVRRGGWIFLLAFLFRLQAFLVSPGSPPVALLKVDILNVMGPALAAAGLIWCAAPGPRSAVLGCAGVAAAIALLTPIVRTSGWVDGLPDWVERYIRPARERTTFTLFPWSGFVLAGAAAGTLLAPSRAARSEKTFIGALTASGAALVAVGFLTASRPPLYAASSFWTSSPTFFAIRVGILLLVLGAMFVLRPLAARLPGPFAVLERFGAHSLFVYWIHVELVYGYATWPIHRSLPLWAAVAAYGLFSAAMYGAVRLQVRVVRRWRSRGPSGGRASPAPA